MIGKLAMKVLDRFEAGYSGVLGRLAREERFLGVVGRLHAIQNLHKRLTDRAQEQALKALGQPTRGELADTHRALQLLEAETRNLRREVEALREQVPSKSNKKPGKKQKDHKPKDNRGGRTR